MRNIWWEILSINSHSQWWDNPWWWDRLQVKLRWCQTNRRCTCSLVSLEWCHSRRWWHQNSNKWWCILNSLWWWTKVKFLIKLMDPRKSSSNNKLFKPFLKIYFATLTAATSLERIIVSMNCVVKGDVANECVKNIWVDLHVWQKISMLHTRLFASIVRKDQRSVRKFIAWSLF